MDRQAWFGVPRIWSCGDRAMAPVRLCVFSGRRDIIRARRKTGSDKANRTPRRIDGSIVILRRVRVCGTYQSDSICFHARSCIHRRVGRGKRRHTGGVHEIRESLHAAQHGTTRGLITRHRLKITGRFGSRRIPVTSTGCCRGRTKRATRDQRRPRGDRPRRSVAL